jgi:peptidoglycan/LPS O-acetylase OafA/YrhL
MSTGRKNFALLDGLRGVAATFVITCHASALWGGAPCFHSYLAVDLFFVMSGFVIATAYGGKLANGRLVFRDFMVVRLIRLYPLFFLSAMVCGAISYHHHFEHGLTSSKIGISLILTLFCLPSFLGHSPMLFPLNLVFWSIFYELIVNVLYGYWHRMLTVRVLAVGLIAMVLAMIALAGC